MCQILGHSSDTRSDLHNKIIRSDTCRLNDLLQYMFINQKVLSEFFLKHKFVFLQYFYGIFPRVGSGLFIDIFSFYCIP